MRRTNNQLLQTLIILCFALAPPCSEGLDIGIVLDKSRSETKKDLRMAIDFLARLVDKFNPGPDKDHFGLVTFNRKAVTEFTFAKEAHYNKDQLKARIEQISLVLNYKTRTDLAMVEARDNLFSPSGGDRPNKPNVMIFLTDGRPTHQPKPFEQFAEEFHNNPKVLR